MLRGGSLAAILESEGYRVESEANALDALRRLQARLRSWRRSARYHAPVHGRPRVSRPATGHPGAGRHSSHRHHGGRRPARRCGRAGPQAVLQAAGEAKAARCHPAAFGAKARLTRRPMTGDEQPESPEAPPGVLIVDDYRPNRTAVRALPRADRREIRRRFGSARARGDQADGLCGGGARHPDAAHERRGGRPANTRRAPECAGPRPFSHRPGG